MLNELDPFDFLLCEKLGMTLEELRTRMSNNEYHQWRAFFTYRDAMVEFEMNKSKRSVGFHE